MTPLTVLPMLDTMLLIEPALEDMTETRFVTALTTFAIPLHARLMPAPIPSIAAPNTPIPSAPAVSAGPSAAVTAISPTIPAPIPASTAIAGPPAAATLIAALANVEIACAISQIDAPTATSWRALPAIVLNDAPAVATGAAAVAAAPPNLPTCPAMFPIPPAMVEIPPSTLPPIAKTGPATAARPATLIIKSCISGDNPLQASDSFDTPSLTDDMISDSAGPAASTISAPSCFNSFSVVVNESIGSSVPSNVSFTDPSKSPRLDEKSERFSVPFDTAFSIAPPARLPNSSYAAANLSDSDALLPIVCSKSDSAWSSVFPSPAAFFMAVLRPIMAVDVSRPAIDAEPKNDADSSADNPISWNCFAFAATWSASAPTSTPVCWPTVLSASSIRPASCAPRPKPASILLTESTELDTSWSFSAANLTNLPDKSSNASPVTPNRVLTSPIAAPAVEKSVGMLVVRLFRIPCMLSKASPDAPVFVTMVSSPSSTSFHAATDAVPMATIGAVTDLESAAPAPVIFSPIDLDIFCPAVSPAFVPACPALLVRSFVIFSCAPASTGVTVIVA